MISFLANTSHLYNNGGFACCHGHHCYHMVTTLRKHQMKNVNHTNTKSCPKEVTFQI